MRTNNDGSKDKRADGAKTREKNHGKGCHSRWAKAGGGNPYVIFMKGKHYRPSKLEDTIIRNK